MSGHMTRMSRGSSVGSSASRPSSTSRSTSIWRAGPWQRAPAPSGRRRVSVRPSGRTALAAMSDCSQPSRVSGSGRGQARYSSVCGSGGQAALQLAQVAAEGGEQRMARPRGGWCRRGGGSGRARRRATCHRSSLGCGSHRCRSWWVDSASSSSISVLGSRVWPNSDSRSRQVGRRLLQAGKGFRVPDVRRVGVDAVERAPATAAAASRGRRRRRRRRRSPSR